MTLKKSLLGGACLGLQPLLLNALSVPAMAYIIRGLGATAYGQWTMATALTATIGLLANLGLRGVFVRHVAAHPENASAAVAQQLGLRLALAVLAALLLISVCIALRYPPIVIGCALISAAAMIATTAATTLIDLLQALHRSTTVAMVNLIAGLILTFSSVLVVWIGFGPIGLALAYLVGPIASVTMLTVMVQRTQAIRVRLSLRGATSLLKQSRSFASQQLLNNACLYADALLLPRLIGATGFGFYSAGALLPNRLSVVPDGLCTAAYPLLTRRFRENPASAVRMTFGYLGIVLFACLPLAIFVALLSGPIARILFPHQPEICRQVILVTIWTLPLFGIESVLGYAINAAGADAAQARASLPAAMCNIALTIILMSRLGIAGACIAIPLRNAVRIVILGICFMRNVWTHLPNDLISQAALAT
jgi:O-antigen/teichoic acid export membrane protein